MIVYYREHKQLFLILLVLVFLFYGNSLKNKFALDDDYITSTNFPVKGQPYKPNNNLVAGGIKSIPTIWKSRYAHDNESVFEYRPVTTSSFAIEYWVFGQNPFVNHLINILIYYFSICLLFCVLLELLEGHESKLNVAFLISLLFLIHPIHTEVVNNIKCRDELFALFFPLLAFWFSFSFYKKPNVKDVLIVILFLLLGIFSKRSALVFLAIIPLAFIFYRTIKPKIITISIISSSFIYGLSLLVKKIFLTEKAVRHFYHFENPLYIVKLSFLGKIVVAIKTLGFYIKFSIFPFPFRYYYGGNTFDVSPSINLYFFIAVIFLAFLSYYYYKTKNKLFLFGLLLFLGSILPFLNIVVPVAGVLGERLAYIASIGFCIIIVSFLEPYLKDSSIINLKNLFSKPKIFGLIIILVCMVYVWNRNSNWYNKVSLFEHDIPYLETSAKANSLLANEYFEMLRSPNKKYPDQVLIQKCLKHYNLAVTNDSSFFSAYNNAGVIYYSYLNDIPMAKKYFTLGIRHRPKYSQAYENLGNCYGREENISKAYECYKKAIEINPKQYTAFTACINLFFEKKSYEKALEVIGEAHLNFPNNYELTAQEGNCYLMKGDTVNALKRYEKAYDFNPDKKIAQYISKKFFEIGDTLNALKYQNK